MIEMAARPDRRNPVVGCLIPDDAIVPGWKVRLDSGEVVPAAWFVQRHARDVEDLDFLARVLGIGGM